MIRRANLAYTWQMLVRVLVVWGLIWLCECICADGQQNSWTNPSSGQWEEMNWSLGELPGPGQAVFIENSGWKAVAIGSTTVQNFAQTIRPASITISSPTNSYNVLLLNYVGFQTPVSVLQLRIYENAGLTTLSSALEVNNALGGAFSIGGTFNQGENSTVSTASVQIGDVGPGTYNLTNGSLAASAALSVGGNFPAHFNQYGGSNFTADIQLYTGGEYAMYGGGLTASNLIYRPENSMAGNFEQFGGTVAAGVAYVTMGEYRLAGGSMSCSQIQLPGVTSVFDYPDIGKFIQTGGSNFTELVSIGNFPAPYMNASPSGDYTLSSGVLNTTSTVLGPFGSMEQYGGTHITDSLGLEGDETAPHAASDAFYSLSGGLLSAHGLQMHLGNFVQNGGTNQITGDLMVTWKSYYNSTFQLRGGLLQTSNTTVVGNSESGGGFTQSGGTQIVSNLLSISRTNASANYLSAYNLDFLLSGGQLIAQYIDINGGATFHHYGGSVINNGTLTLANGTWEANTNTQMLGKLQVGNSQKGSSTILFPNGGSRLGFAKSDSMPWSSDALLTIEHWNGSLTGGGNQQLYFGNDGAGLTSGQLARIRFHNPAGATGSYPATILATGEVVPTQVLVSQQTAGGLVLSWTSGMVLQTSTNLSGPFEDITTPTSYTHTVNFSEPMRFFRLRTAGNNQPVFANH